MRAAVVERYGPPEIVKIVDVPTPVVRKGEILVAVRSVAVTAADARIRAARFPRGFGIPGRLAFGLNGPRRAVLGSAFSGTVVAKGADVSGFLVGDDVCGMTGLKMGAHAELAAVKQAKAVVKPEQVSHDDAAAILFGASTALHYLEDKAALRSGQTVLVNGASGAVGSAAVQLARIAGATVTAVTRASNAALVRSLGADDVIDYRTSPVDNLVSRFDVVLDAVGNLTPTVGRRLLTDQGVLLLAAASLRDTLSARGNVKAGPAPESAEGFARVLQLVASGRLRAVIDDVAVGDGLGAIVAAYERIDSGRKIGNIVIRP